MTKKYHLCELTKSTKSVVEKDQCQHGFYVVIRGPLGCGKTTIAKKLAKAIKGDYLAVDQVMADHDWDHAIPNGYIPAKSFIQANSVIAQKAQKAVKKNRPIVIEGNFYWKSVTKDLIRKLGFQPYFFTLKAPIKICILRDQNRRGTIGEDAVRAVYKKTTKFDVGIKINVEKPVEESVKAILSHLPKSKAHRF